MAPKKKTKKQIEEEKALAEQERKIQEELERKRAEEQAERERIAEAKRLAEEKKRKEEELVRLVEEAPFVNDRDAAMISKRALAIKSRVKDLDDKFISCDPLPDPNDEKDLTTFITLWRESKDKTLGEASRNCQIAENVIKRLQLIYGEALSQYDHKQIKWCQDYMQEIRRIMIAKYDEISQDIFTYIENYTQYTDEELLEEKKKSHNRKIEGNQKQEFTLKCKEEDMNFGMWANVAAKMQHVRKVEFDCYKSGLPHQQKSMQLIMRNSWTSFDYVSGPENHKKSDIICVGGVVLNKLFSYPEPPRPMLGWKMRRVLSIDQCLKEIPYPDPASTVQTEAVPCVFELPPYVFITDNDENQVGVWDEKLQEWCTDYIEDLEYRKKERELVFNTRKFAPIAYIQSKTTDFPYDSFYLRCIKDQVALLSIVTKRINVNIQIHPLFVKLIDMEQPELVHLVNKELHIGILLMELSKCGIHMLPENEDAARANIHLKDSATEERAILDIATTLKVFSFQSTKWCQQSDQENIVVRLRENPDNDKVFLEDDESDWKSIMWSPNKVSYIKCKNCDETFNSTIDDGQVTHAVLPLALKGVQSEDACERSQYTHDIDFIDNVQRTLRLLRLLSFTTNAYDKRTLEEQQQ